MDHLGSFIKLKTHSRRCIFMSLLLWCSVTHTHNTQYNTHLTWHLPTIVSQNFSALDASMLPNIASNGLNARGAVIALIKCYVVSSVSHSVSTCCKFYVFSLQLLKMNLRTFLLLMYWAFILSWHFWNVRIRRSVWWLRVFILESTIHSATLIACVMGFCIVLWHFVMLNLYTCSQMASQNICACGARYALGFVLTLFAVAWLGIKDEEASLRHGVCASKCETITAHIHIAQFRWHNVLRSKRSYHKRQRHNFMDNAKCHTYAYA